MWVTKDIRVVVISGARDLDAVDSGRVVSAVLSMETWPHLRTVRVGGARGTDSVALGTLASYREPPPFSVEVVVPFRMSDQPVLAREAYQRAKSRKWIRLVELDLPKGDKRMYLTRNEIMLDGAPLRGLLGKADALIAAWHGRPQGGTFQTMLAAGQRHIQQFVVPVVGMDSQSND